MLLNIFRVLGDVSHVISKCILITSIHSNKSAEGVSLITQVLYIVVFLTRYIDLFWTFPFRNFLAGWNFTLKIFYILSSIYIVFLMMRVFARTREREKAWTLGAYSLGGALLGMVPVVAVFEGKYGFRHPFEIQYTFSLILESVCILPQLLLLRQTTVPTVIDSFYLTTLGSYRAFYILNWIVRGSTEKHQSPIFPISVTFGVIQTLFYFDFAWVYWSRQRVKLRGGGIVDGEDMSRGWLISRIIGRRYSEDDADDEETGRFMGQEEGIVKPPAPQHSNSWGPRGISVSADEGVMHARDSKSAGMMDPEEFADDIEDDAVVVSPQEEDLAAQSGVSSGAEWLDDNHK
ncbi:hypothetical protein MBLNU459_g4308t1 [Dothideomycetes sp. NU459]